MTHETDHAGPASAGPLFDAVALVLRIATGAVLAALVLLICTEATLRGLFNYSLGFTEELSGYFVVALTFFGGALALRWGALFRVGFLFDLLPARVQAVLARAFIAVALAACVVLAWRTFDLVQSSFSRGNFAPTVLRTPLWIPELLLPIGFALIAFFLVEQFLIAGRGAKGDK